MQDLNVCLLGKFRIQSSCAELFELESRKAEELFCYLLINRERPHPREALADLLWGKDEAQQSKSYLRKALWQLQAALDHLTGGQDQHLLLVEPEWLQINPAFGLWLDIGVIETAFHGLKGISGRSLTQEQAQALEDAVALYHGDLMEGCYWDWCLFERERLQYQFLTLLEKLMDFYEQHQDFENGLACGERILRYDRAHERTHTRLMRLHYLAGNRTAALRQYEKCQAILLEELDTGPGETIRQLYQQIRQDAPVGRTGQDYGTIPITGGALPDNAALQSIYAHLGHFYEALNRLQAYIQQDIQALERVMRH